MLVSGCSTVALAQVTVNLPRANIQNRTDYQQTIAAGQYTSLLGLLPTFSVRSNTPNFTNLLAGTETAPLNLAYIKMVSVGSVSLVNVASEVALSTGYQQIYASLVSLLSGPVTVNLRLRTANHRWLAGAYTGQLSFLAPGLLGVGNQINPPTQDITINVPGFIAPPATVGNTQIAVNNLSYYRGVSGIAVNKSIAMSTTVPYQPTLQSGATSFNFSTTVPYNQLPSSPVGTVSVGLTGIVNASPITLSSAVQGLTTTAGIAVPPTNNQTLTAVFSISGANLKSSFVQAGTYTVPITYAWNKLASAYPATPIQESRTGSVDIVVSDLGELVANQNAVPLVFASTGDYQQGVIKDMPAHLRISKTTPYNLYVRAASSSFASGTNTIPLSVLRIGPMPGESGMNTVTLSATPQQLIDAANPVIDRNLNVRYTIPASEVGQIVGKPAGVYSVNVVFSFEAP